MTGDWLGPLMFATALIQQFVLPGWELRAEVLLERFRLTERWDVPFAKLSRGMKRTLTIAAALAHQPEIVFLDEPTTGLHTADLQRLIDVLQKLVDEGNTVAVIEHNMEIIKEADYIIDLGPEGGNDGGRVVATGSPPELLKYANTSHTARCFKRYLEGSRVRG